MSTIFSSNRVPDNFFPSRISPEVYRQLSTDVQRDVADAYLSSDAHSSTQLMDQLKNDNSWYELHNAYMMAQMHKQAARG